MIIEAMEQLGPEFFDIFGFLAFTYVIFVAHKLFRGEKISKPLILLLLLVSIGGFIVDLLFVSTTYLIR